MTTLIDRFVREEQGQDLIEYALLAGLIALVSIMAIDTLGLNIKTTYTGVGSAVTAAGAAS